jgi:signal transduction histidine kinase/HAMP domain-containing protein
MMPMIGRVVDLVARVPARVQVKLLAAFLTITMLLIMLGAVGLQVLSGVNERTEKLIGLQRKIEAYRQVQHDTISQLYSVSAALLSSDDQTLSSTLRQLNEFGYDVDRLQFVAKDEVELLGQFRQDYDRFVEIVTHGVDMIHAGRASEAREMQAMQAAPLADRLERLTNQLVNKAEADMITGIEISRQAYDNSQLIVIAFALGSILLALALGYTISWSLIGPVKQIEAQLNQVAAGQFTQRVNVINRDELGTLGADVNRTSDELGRLYQQLRQRTDELGRLVEELRALGEVSQAVNSTLDLEAVLSTIVAKAVQLSGAEAGAIYVFDEQQRKLHLRATYGMDQELVGTLTKQQIGLNDPTVARALAQHEPIQIADLKEQAPSIVNEIILRAGFRALLLTPLLRGGEIVGMLVVRRHSPGEFAQSIIDLIRTFGAQSAVAIENARLFHNIEASLEQLRSAQDRLVQTQKLASLGQLTAGIAHEIKNPLNFVNNFSGVSAELIDELREALGKVKIDTDARAEITELTDTLRNNLDKIVQHGKRADSIVKNMLLHSREGSGENRPVNVNALVDEAVNLAYHGARAEKQGFDITLERSLDPAAGHVDCFPQEITRVLLNLISNGFYAATKRKADFGGNGFEPTLVAGTKNLGDRVEIRIRDNGAGIPPDVKDKMFNPFFTTKPAGEGTGLGLSISHDIIVKQHLGTIEVDTQPGEFTEVRIVLPRAAAFIVAGQV